ncbi:MAG: carboxypeptidase-like regulatory domain-containing protein [Acidobacteriaceae bacterium]
MKTERSSYAEKMRCAFVLPCLLLVFLRQPAKAQATAGQATEPARIQNPPQPEVQNQTSDDIQRTLGGVVTDQDGAVLPGADVTLQSAGKTRSTTTDGAGKFTFSNMPAGPYTLTLTAKGMQSRIQTGTLNVDESLDLPPIALMASTNEQVVVSGLTQHQLAEVQMKQEEKQRFLGAFPNFYVSYNWNAAPLSPGQKFNLAIHNIVDPATFIVEAGIAGLEQATDEFSGYGQGWQGYGKRYGAGLANKSISGLLGSAALPVLFHQDPRYFYKGTGTKWQRARYAISRAWIVRGDNGKWQPAYAAILGDYAAGAISNLYYPASNQHGVGLTIANGTLAVAGNAAANLMQEFLFKKLTKVRKSHKSTAQASNPPTGSP